MAYTYERIVAPSEELSDFGARKLGLDIEWPIWAHYLSVTGAPIRPPQTDAPADWRDTGVVQDYIKLLRARHSNLKEKELQADSHVQGQLPVPDISTYQGRYVPPRYLSTQPARIEDTSRSEYYEIKPNSPDGEYAGRKKLKDIASSYKRYGLYGTYSPGKAYPTASPEYIPLKWSAAFEYLRLCFMWHNNLKQCDIDLQVLRPPDCDGLVLYAIRIRLGLDVELAAAKLTFLAAGILVAMAACAAADVLALMAEIAALEEGIRLANELRELLKSLPDDPPKVRVRISDPNTPTIPAFEQPIENIPPIEEEIDPDIQADTEELPRRKRAIYAATVGAGFALAGRKMDIYCDEDYYQNIIADRSSVQRFISLTRVGIPLSPSFRALSAYFEYSNPVFVAVSDLLNGIDQRLPNQVRLTGRELIPNALRRALHLPSVTRCSIVSQVLAATPSLSAFLDPPRAQHAAQVVAPGKGLAGSIALPARLLARWQGTDPATGAQPAPPTPASIAAGLLGPNPDPGAQQGLLDSLANLPVLRHALQTGPGCTVAIGTHSLYSLSSGPTSQSRYGTFQTVNVSRLFAVTVREGASAPGKPLEQVDCSKSAAEPLNGVNGRYRYLGRIKVKM